MLSLAVVAIAVHHVAIAGIDRQVDLRLKAEGSDLLGRRGEAADRAAVIARIQASEAQRASYTLGYMLLDAGGRRLAGTVSMRRPPSGYSDVNYTDKLEGLEGIDKGRAFAISTRDGDLLVVVADTDPVDGSLRIFTMLLATGFGAVGVIMMLGMLSMINAIRSHMQSMRAVAQSIVNGDMKARLPLSGRNDEFDREARALNQMLERIADLMNSLKHLSDDVAHDLRTPLSQIRNQLMTIDPEAGKAIIQSEIDQALAACNDLLQLFTAILRLGEIESGARRASFNEIDLEQLVETVVETMTPVIEADGRVMQSEGLHFATIHGDRALLAQMLINAIDNAARHTPVGTVICVRVQRDNNGLTIVISDNGPGIDACNRAVALRRFGRLDASRSTAGHGLGLSMLDAIARLHGGHVTLEDASPGLIVAITLPLPRDPTARSQTIEHDADIMLA